MNRPVYIWLLFSICLAVLAAAMGWVSLAVLRLDRMESQAQIQADYEEKVRLALWRLDSLLAPLIIEESSRPYYSYSAFYSLDQVYPNLQISERILAPSPLLAFSSSNILVHFQFELNGAITSPQIPALQQRIMAEATYVQRQEIETAAARLAQFQQILQQGANSSLATAVPAASGRRPQGNYRDLLANFTTLASETSDPSSTGATHSAPPEEIESLKNQAQNSLLKAPTRESQMFRNNVEWHFRQQAVQNFDKTGATYVSPEYRVQEGPLKAVWIGPNLVLARRVALEAKTFIQGCWLNWPVLKNSLLAQIEDLFPEADLLPSISRDGEMEERGLAFLPVKLDAPPFAGAAIALWTPIRISLAIAWICALAAGLAVGLLLQGTISLSERRAAFVSAVTHELRTPLTTFKMYAEMLAADMVSDPEKRRAYLTTLCSEANRLGHLVENVLAYARLERGSARGRLEKLRLSDLVERVQPRLIQRAEQGGFHLESHLPEPVSQAMVQVDAAAVEQVLFNLVDNACKYAAPAADRTIHLEAGLGQKFAMLRIRDHGQGIQDARRLFRPFSKSAREAAHTAPGVGLGLALCRRLSRSMGGDLRLDQNPNGACFVLTVPLN